MTTNQLPAEARSGNLKVEIHRDIRIPTSDPAVTLSGDLYRPVSSSPVPALVTLQPYRRDMAGTFWEPSMQWLAQRGYACLLVEARGIGSSNGVPRPRCHQGEGEDAVAAIEWTSAQTWCTGDVGMWGCSASGLTSMRAASRSPAQLKAIIPIMNPLDGQRYRGARGDLGLIVQWAGAQLVQQLMPPLLNYTSIPEQQRWQQRLHETEPFIMDRALHFSRDPLWQDRLIDAESITIPTFCVGGWRDLHCDQIIRAYESISGPKKLIIGPWAHSLPHNSPFEPIDFLSISLRWWDYWLRGIDNGVMDEPPVTLCMEGRQPAWRSFEEWPPSKTELVLTTGASTTLEPSIGDNEVMNTAIAEYLPDPTLGALAGLGGENAGFGLPLDQHDDDTRALSATSNPLPSDLMICGRPTLSVRLASDQRYMVQRLVARLTEVDAQDRSSLITTGVLCPDEQSKTYLIMLGASTRQVPAGHRLRVVLSDSDFPRLTPLPNPCPIRVAGLEVSIPSVTEDFGVPADITTINSPVGGNSVPGATVDATGHWAITRDPIHDGVEITIGSETTAARTPQGHLLDTRHEARATVRRAAPDAAVTTGTHTSTARMNTGETISATVTIRCTQTALWVRGELSIDGTTTYSRVWEAPLAHGQPPHRSLGDPPNGQPEKGNS